MFERYARQIIMPEIGKTGQEKLLSSHVLVAGVGGLGSFASFYLAAIGIGRLTLIDNGSTVASDLNRQILYSTNTLGHLKVETAEKRLRGFNPDIVVEAVFEEVTESGMAARVEGVNAVVDGMDTFRTRRILNRVCFENGVPFIYGGVSGLKGSVTTVMPGRAPCLECILPAEEPAGPIPVLAPTVGLVAAFQVMETVTTVLRGGGTLQGQLLRIDAGRASVWKAEIKGREDCAVCKDAREAQVFAG